ncbi:succinyl-CoA synthetase beta subunit [Penicillium lagena]|uniref:succinyl-CoA synthetase beta subunit n=1 Tax=Penicillium lagena TaxID=94218 RepID=UPI00253FABC3|nr:succinyl-CoA synthetase beta subunit [Penicillium lagena]KAJ5605036.1 succinyl-CoA synthetase beta subunit [Penicillium lagena]
MFKLARSRPIAAAFRAATMTVTDAKLAPQESSVQSRLALQQKRNLSIHEYLSARLLKSYGVGVPKGEVARTPEEAEAVARSIGMHGLPVFDARPANRG